ncbi:conserved hypothetical protein [Brochothrix thermosphacta]|uniref:Uncharacterized protein n=1 Tax=Brochothrix thermosphacta TaxID=2756 RepID=A0A2X0QQI8_BROTH|nr:hypothetical protein FM106_28870 [Brachybacterium faecium]SPP26102.1 conserved hypothetical protein [Brochothrix thermosphacta]SPP29945.1 conserved hypothetical protein [Brochothrix thermosphacta]
MKLTESNKKTYWIVDQFLQSFFAWFSDFILKGIYINIDFFWKNGVSDIFHHQHHKL